MRGFFKGLGIVVLLIVGAAIMFFWYATDAASFQKAALWILIPLGIWHLLNEFVLKPIMAEFRELHRRLDVIEGRSSQSDIFD
jgi:hypothetical protein